jgi:phosphinothricin acetyltransferase
VEEALKIRFANRADLPAIVEIYNQAIKSRCSTGDVEEYTIEQRIEWFEKYDPDQYPIYVAELAGEVVGYCTLSPYRPGRKAMSRIAEVSYYLDNSFHGIGIGTALLKFVLSDCARIGKESLLAILLDINPQSIKILKKFNFKQWGHYPDIIEIDGKRCGQLIYGLKIGHSSSS